MRQIYEHFAGWRSDRPPEGFCPLCCFPFWPAWINHGSVDQRSFPPSHPRLQSEKLEQKVGIWCFHPPWLLTPTWRRGSSKRDSTPMCTLYSCTVTLSLDTKVTESLARYTSITNSLACIVRSFESAEYLRPLLASDNWHAPCWAVHLPDMSYLTHGVVDV